MKEFSGEARLLPDRALEKPERDQLGYSDFSKQLAEFVSEDVPPTDFVIGIYGAWGSGKSTILKFTEFYLKQQGALIIKFNPWWFSGQADLIGKYFSELESGLGADENFENLRKHIQRFSSVLSRIPSSATGGMPVGPAASAINAWMGSEAPPLGDIKEDISDILVEEDREMVVIIDDIDRLTDEEIKQMFRLVKSVADFSNVTYILAFDHNIVIEALGGEQGPGNGEEYLEKIIQLPQHVPLPEEGTLRSFFGEKLDPILDGDNQIWDESRWHSAYRRAIVPNIQTPRDAVRLSNAIKSLYFRVGKEVNFVDLVIIETLRLFYRPIYEHIRENKEDFIVRSSHMDVSDDKHSFIGEDIDESERDLITTLIGYLFPHYGTGASSIHVGSIGKFRKHKRVCHSICSFIISDNRFQRVRCPLQKWTQCLNPQLTLTNFQGS
jgi:predicted KAP-like P-loop ATPase